MTEKKAKPTALLSLEGALRKAPKKPKPEKPPRAVTDRFEDIPPPPDGMSEQAASEWLSLAPVAHELGVLSEADVRAFRLLCETLATATEAGKTLDSDGLLIEGLGGAKKHHPAIKVLENARQQSTRLFAEFGMTPKARSGKLARARDTNPRRPGGR